MNVAYVSNVVYPFVQGGAQKRIHEIGTRLVDRGHDVTIYGRHYWDGPSVMEYQGIQLRAVAPARELYVDGRRSITEALTFAARLLRPLHENIEAHDIVDVSVFPYFPVLASAISNGSVPLVTTWHEVWQEYWHEYLGPLGLVGRGVERAVAAVPQHPIAVSPTTARQLVALGFDRSNITVVPNGVDIDHIRQIPPGDDGYDVLFAGRLVPDKNVDLLVRAFSKLAREGATLGIVGDGPERSAIESIVKNLDMDDAVDVLGRIDDHDAVIAQMQAAEVFVLPSTREGFGMSVLEARAAGCRVVVADHSRSAASDLIGETGIAVAPTIDGLASGIERALSAGPVPKDDGLERYDWDAIATDALQTYRSVLEDR